MTEASDLENVFTQRQRIAQLARQAPELAFTSLNHLLQRQTLREAYEQTRQDGAVGVDGQTAADYAADLEANLQSLLERAKSGTYRAPPVRRVHIPKDGAPGETRPLGIPTFEDKVLQRAVVNVLQPIYEQDFLHCSFGFRPQRSAHQALAELREGMMALGGGWVLDVDIRKFFDTLDHRVLQSLLRRRVRDGVLLRLLGKWLHAGVLEAGELTHPAAGSPQGGVISPLLANVYLHYVLDEWFAQEVKPRLRGAAFLIRYADDFVMVFADEADARRVGAVLPQRFARFGLTIHPEKTRLVPFGRPRTPRGGTVARAERPGTFDFLGFTHYWGKSRNGYWVVKVRTAKARLRRALQRVADWCQANRHRPIPEQAAALRRKLHGHYGYYGLTGNSAALGRVYWAVRRRWHEWLARRSNSRSFTWRQFAPLLQRFPLPPPRLVHPAGVAFAKP